MEKILEGKVAFVTGGGKGMGRAYAEGLSGEGASVVVTDQELGSAQEVANAIVEAGGTSMAIRCNVANEAEIHNAVSVAVERFGGLDIVVNNAALHLTKWTGPFASLKPAELQLLFDVNILGTVKVIMACRETMVERGGGSIVNVSSTSGYLADSPYGVTKLAVRGLTVAFARELGPDNIRVNAIAPGVIYTDSALEAFGEDRVDQLREKQVVQRRGEVQDVVEMLLFLVSDKARFVTGETIKVAAGFVLTP